MRGADLAADARNDARGNRRRALRAAPFAGKVGAGQCVRIMTGGVMPAGADTVVMQERAQASRASRVTVARRPADRPERAPRRRRPAARRGRRCRRAACAACRAGTHRLAGYRRSERAAGPCASRSSPPATSCVSIGTPLGEGEVYDSNRYTHPRHAHAPGLRGASTWAWCATIRRCSRRAFREAAASADASSPAAASRWAKPTS